MAHFKIIYEGTQYTPAIISGRMNLFERDGSWKGQKPGEMIGLYLSLQGEPFTYDIPEDPDEHFDLQPNVDTQWLQLPLSAFRDRNLRSLDGISIVYDGPGSINSLTGEEWAEPPGLLGTYGDDAFGPSRIDISIDENALCRLRLQGETEGGTVFDVDYTAPLGVSLTSYTGQDGDDRLRRWFDTSLKWDDFSWERSVFENSDGPDQHSLQGTFAAAR
ncbi:hypothetical protein [Endobacterium cereale]|uniref:hypothetical protein n=1 Tax=Endobacterium cereale TaxID=2663029 RepID=UPI002B4A2968|nr:hypothetical protein [Endobacterium cereale]MEB2845769.1 hypothetical protein [Endobacterium cereale]